MRLGIIDTAAAVQPRWWAVIIERDGSVREIVGPFSQADNAATAARQMLQSAIVTEGRVFGYLPADTHSVIDPRRVTSVGPGAACPVEHGRMQCASCAG